MFELKVERQWLIDRGFYNSMLRKHARRIAKQAETIAIRSVEDIQSQGNLWENIYNPATGNREDHLASAPYEPPNSFSGILAEGTRGSIFEDSGEDGAFNTFGAALSATANYAEVLEFGGPGSWPGKEVLPRPFLKPALEQSLDANLGDIQDDLNSMARTRKPPGKSDSLADIFGPPAEPTKKSKGRGVKGGERFVEHDLTGRRPRFKQAGQQWREYGGRGGTSVVYEIPKGGYFIRSGRPVFPKGGVKMGGRAAGHPYGRDRKTGRPLTRQPKHGLTVSRKDKYDSFGNIIIRKGDLVNRDRPLKVVRDVMRGIYK